MEFCACGLRRAIVHLDMDVESRNFAQQDAAAKSKDLKAEDVDEGHTKKTVFQYEKPFGDAMEGAGAPALEREAPLNALPSEGVASLEEAVSLLTRRGGNPRPGQKSATEAHETAEQIQWRCARKLCRASPCSGRPQRPPYLD